MSYLGKISAIVSANTGDYVRKLNDSARTTQSFAKTIQSDLNKASADARKSFDAILTPLQRFERAIQNAAGMKLKFRGADVAIRDVRELAVLISKLERQRDIDFAVKASGLKNITELKSALTSISQDSMDIVARVGLQGLVEARAKLDSIEEVDGKKVTILIDAKKAAEYDAAIAAYNTLGGKKAVETLIRVIGRDQLKQAISLEKQLVSAAEEINTPLAAATRKYEQMGAAVQIALGPALRSAQEGVDGMKNSLDQGDKVGRATFSAIRKEALLTAAAIGRVAEAEEMAGRLTGRSSRSSRPGFAATMTRAERLQNEAIGSGGGFSGALSRQKSAADAVVVALAKIEAAQRTAGADVRAATDEYRRRLEILKQVGDEIEKQLQAEKTRAAIAKSRQDVAFAVTGKPQNIEQAEAAYNSLIGKVQQLSAAQRKAFAPNLKALGALVAAGDAAALKDARRLIAEIEKDLAKQGRLDVSTAEAKKKIDDIKDRLRSVWEAMTGRAVDPFDQLANSAAKARRAIDKVADARRRAALERRLARVDSAIAADIVNDNLTPRQLASRARQRARRLNAISETAGRETSSADMFGSALNSRERNIDLLRANISSIKSSLDTLPASIRAGFVPAIRAAEKDFARLNSLGPTATARQIEAARRRVQALGDEAAIAANKFSLMERIRTGFGGAGAAGINAGLNEMNAQAATNQLTVLQGVIASVGNAARGPLATAFDAVRNKIQAAVSAGTIGTRAVRDEIEKEIQALGNLAAKAASIDPTKLSKDLRRVGDVGRMGLDRWSLALQQAGFAVDDFFSSTGDVDQRIRAVSNNITQMAFVLGSTKGLWIAIGVVIATQAALALRKWINEGRTAEDQTKALNESLLRQQSIVDRLKSAFESLGDAMSRGTLGDDAERAASAARSISEVTKARREAAEDRVLESDPRSQVARANKAKAERERDAATTFGGRAAAQAAMDAAQAEIDRRRILARMPAPDAEEVMQTVRRRGTGRFAGGRMFPGSLPEGGGVDAMRARRDALGPVLEDARMRMMDAANRGDSIRLPILAESYTQLRNLADRLDAAISMAGDEVVRKILEDGLSVGKALADVQKSLADVPFSQTRAEAEKVALRLKEITDELEGGTTPERNAELQAEMAALKEQSAQYRSAAEVIRTFADTVKRISTDLADKVAGEISSIAEQDVRNANAADARSLMQGFPEGLSVGPNGEENWTAGEANAWARIMRQRQERSRMAAREAQDAADRVREENDVRRRQFEARTSRDPQVVAERKRLEELQAIIDKPIPEGATQAEREKAVNEKSAAAAEKARLERARERQYEDSPEGRAARRSFNDMDMAMAQYRESRKASDEEIKRAMRGRTLGMSDAERAAEEARSGMLDIGFAKALGILDEDEANKRANQFAQDQMRNAAPAIFEMADQVANAVLQGPSRQALEVTDVSTMEGSRELNRLLRGDDASKNANLVELEKQSQKLTELNTTMREVADKMGITLNMF